MTRHPALFHDEKAAHAHPALFHDEKAAHAYDKAALEALGEYARLNFPAEKKEQNT